jgi:hypothetical protein
LCKSDSKVTEFGSRTKSGVSSLLKAAYVGRLKSVFVFYREQIINRGDRDKNRKILYIFKYNIGRKIYDFLVI